MRKDEDVVGVTIDDPDEKERKRAEEPQAVFTDAYFVTAWEGHIRIAFGENPRGKPRYSMAVVLPMEEAEDLAAEINVLVNRQKEKDTHRE